MRFFLIVMLIWANNLFAQKPGIDSVAYNHWESLGPGNPILTNDGKYVMYQIQNIPFGSRTQILRATNNTWKKEFIGGLNNPNFTADGRFLLFKKGKDSLAILTLGTDHVKYMPDVFDFSVQRYKNEEIICYRPASSQKKLALMNLTTNLERSYIDVADWKFTEDGKGLVFWRYLKNNNGVQSLNFIDMETKKAIVIWEGEHTDNLILDEKHRQLVFKANDSIWYFKFTGMSKANCIEHKYLNEEGGKLSLNNINRFSNDGESIFISLKGDEKPKPKIGAVAVWSYLDVKLQSEQEREFDSKSYLVTLDLASKKIIRLLGKQIENVRFPKSKDISDTLALVETSDHIAEPWSIASKTTWDLISVKSGVKRRLSFLNNFRNVEFSTEGKFLIYFDSNQQNYLSYEISTRKIRNITGGIKVSWTDQNWEDFPSLSRTRRGTVAWLKNDRRVIIYDQFDVWLIDPLKKKSGINLTNGYGQKHKTVFNLALEVNPDQEVAENKTVYFSAFNKENKDNGFYSKRLNEKGNPRLLTMGPYIFNTNSGYVPDFSDFTPIKAKDGDVFIVRRMSATEAPNYFVTSDFKTFIKLSNLQPEKKYNWYTTELHTWKSLDGKTLKGILYKPENFDPKRKYPIIFHYYQRKSDGLNAYITPVRCDGCNIDIPTYVSRDYLVFTPDIYYNVGNPMQSTYDAIVSAANYISNLPFVNPKKMGIQGCSFGGLQTNYLVTHTSLFSAAASTSSLADIVSSYGDLAGGVNSLQNYFENGQGRMGKSLWEQPEAYINNSPIFRVDKVKTPILLMHTKKDAIYSYSNALEFFTGLRRLGKKAWMLVYSEGNHGITGKEAEDFSIRMMQYFDHYLKDKPPPIWMTKGIKAERAGLDTGYELDFNVETPGPGILTKRAQLIADSLLVKQPTSMILK